MRSDNLLDTIGSVDERHIRGEEIAAVGGSEKRRFSKKLGIVIAAAAAAAALAMFVGFSEKIGNGRNTLVIGDNEAALSLDLRARDIVIPEKYYTTVDWSSEPQPYFWGRQMDMSPSELVAEFGLEPLGIHNDNFSEEIEFEPNPVWNGKGELLWTYNGEPQLSVHDYSVEFSYYLQSKSLGRRIHINALYITDDDYSSGGNISVYDGMLYKIIRLNDRSECFVENGGAVFSYDGVSYVIGFDTREDSEESLDNTMQLLRDLGVLK